MRALRKKLFPILGFFIAFLISLSPAVEFGDWSADFSNPYFSAWHPGFTLKLYGTNPDTGVTGWNQYAAQGSILVEGVKCLPVRLTTSAGGDIYLYLAQDTSGNIRYIKEGTSSFMPSPPIYFPAATSDGATWSIDYLMGQHRFTIAYHDTYPENSFGYGPYSNSVYIHHYWEGALIGLIAVAPRLGFVLYDGENVSLINEAALCTVEGTVTDAWNAGIISGATVWLDRTPPRKTTTNAQGFYRFVDIPQAYFDLEAQKTLYRNYKETIYTTLGGTVLKNIHMIPQSGVIKGKVQDAVSGLPVANATLQLDGVESTQVHTDAGGLYRMENIRVGTHYIHAWGPSHNLDGRVTEVFLDTETEENFSLSPVYGTIQGAVRNSLTMAPVAGATVQLDDMIETRIVTGADGIFQLKDVAPGVHYFQVWATGYLYYQKRLTIGLSESLNLGDVLLVPESALLPPETDFDFEEGPEGWHFHSVTPSFVAPQYTDDNGHLGLSPGGSQNCFGFWESPFIAFDPGKTYRIRFTVKSDQEDPVQVPTFRLRINSGNNQIGGLLVIDSNTDGDSSPTTFTKTYNLVYTPPSSASSVGFTISFDLVNISSGDNAGAWVYLEGVEIDSVDLVPLE